MVAAVAVAVAVAVAGGGGGGGETTAANNLSYPAVGDAVPTVNATANVPVGGLGQSYSYGCEPDEVIGTTTYPNTSCVSTDGSNFYDEATCATDVRWADRREDLLAESYVE